MSLLRTSSVLLSVAAHGLLLAAFADLDTGQSLEAGSGNDLLRIEQGLAIEGLSRIGDAPETIQAREAETVEASEARPALQEVKPTEVQPEQPPQEVAMLEPPRPREVTPEEKPPPEPDERRPAPPDALQTEKPSEIEDVIASPLGEQRDVLTVPIPPPPKEVKPEPLEEVKEKPPEEVRAPQPEQVATELQVPQVAVEEQLAAAKGQQGGDATVYRAYLGSISKHVEKSKVRPSRVLRGTAVVRFKLDRNGKVLEREIAQSSGSAELDAAALKSIDTADPFPPIPASVGREEIVLTQQFRFVVR